MVYGDKKWIRNRWLLEKAKLRQNGRYFTKNFSQLFLERMAERNMLTQYKNYWTKRNCFVQLYLKTLEYMSP